MDIIIDTETTGKNPHQCRLLGVASYNPNNEECFYTPFEGGKSASFLEDVPSYEVVGHNIKYDAIVLRRHGVAPFKVAYDTMIAYYLLHIDKARKLETISKDMLGEEKEDLVAVYNKATGNTRVNLPDNWYEEVPFELLSRYAEEDVRTTARIKERCDEEFKKRPELKKWFDEVEMPICNILIESELNGVKVDNRQLKELETTFKARANHLDHVLKLLAGDDDINLNSSKQLQALLYTKMKLPKRVKTKKGAWSTDSATLKSFDGNAFVKKLLELKEINKLLNTYILPLQELSKETGRIHCSFNQALTNTRRFSSDSPNLQNIPSNSRLGKLVKGCFVPKKGHKFLSADYSQVELRILAHFSRDENLVRAYLNDEDIHQQTADLLKIDRDPYAKIFNFSLIYGKTPYGLAKDMELNLEEAKNMIENFFSNRTGVKKHIASRQSEVLRNKGWVYTLAGLPLYVGDPFTNDKKEYAGVMRKCVNYPIQSSSQDILKKAIVNIYNKYGLVPVLMIHDQLVYEIPDEDVSEMEERIVYEMENAWELCVPLKVGYQITDRWVK